MNFSFYRRVHGVFFLCILTYPVFSQRIPVFPDPGEATISQQVHQLTEKTYGIDQELVCGEVYEDHYRGAIGTPFFMNEDFTPGKVCYKQHEYNNLSIKYDIYEHRLLADYKHNNSQIRFYLINEFLNSFEVSGRKFVNLTLINNEPQIYQVIESNGAIKCYYSWHKDRVESNHMAPRLSYEFSKDKRKKYLMYNGQVYSFKGKGSFIGVFPKKNHNKIKSYIRQNNIYLANCTDIQMKQLLNYCNSLLSDDEGQAKN